MQQDMTPRRRRWPLILIVLVPVLAGGWSGAWYYAAGRAETVIAGWREREAKAGRIHSCGSQTVSGFPFRFEMRCTDPGLELKSAERPLTIKAKDILITAQVWQPTLLTAEITGPLTIAEPGQPATITANWRHAQTEVRGVPAIAGAGDHRARSAGGGAHEGGANAAAVQCRARSRSTAACWKARPLTIR